MGHKEEYKGRDPRDMQFTNLDGSVRKSVKSTRTDKVAGLRKQESVSSLPKTC